MSSRSLLFYSYHSSGAPNPIFATSWTVAKALAAQIIHCLALALNAIVIQAGPRSDNLFNVTTLPCFKDCALGADCKGVELGPPAAAPPPPNSNSSPPNKPPSSHGLRGLQIESTFIDRLTLLTLAAALFLPWL
ncbi:hypothetical protein CCACVL1_12731 [Corchorus capsularis]|uniref:Uncharacterized protein n=1 Tax=Corchorus capsularis TaxID=210143 RepID=A0A1R3IE75_COCAP|nr:hypothetical protein CCACVL1_12731 [Corchorus capsularis]